MHDRLKRSAVLDRDSYPEHRKEGLKLWVVLTRCFNSFAQAEAHHLKSFKLTPPQFGVLEALAHLGPMKMCDLGTKLLVSGANVTGVIDRLEKKGLVRRVMNSEDRRTLVIHLTEAGSKLIVKFFPIHAERIEAFTNALNSKEKRLLIDLLKKLGKAEQLHPGK
ncbi:MAG: MarR family transcriptional regulator [candidate division KSB1 bacterium]|nr:MarR family transcriptional regulator [candidate division KSB1 bacterium]MDZ7304366.1 MarR family transcriptional regulator [candidate division KSB1 bacterium]MDZ7313515.1 MarR family transcriptional regulator [candidate division KSB1 bacterium]